MFFPQLLILLVNLCVFTNSNPFEVINSGLSILKKNDMIVVFFVTIQHFGNRPRRVMIHMVECCETVSDGDNDCDLIDLYGGDFGIVQPGSVKNLTLLYPTLYGYNRKGHCLVTITHRDLMRSDISELHHKIEFDTRISTEKVPDILQGFYQPEKVILCETPDLDPLNHCHPVDCNLKYSGYRNHYNRRVKMCQRAPICLTDPDKELPDIVYSPIHNMCRDLEKSFTKADFEKILNQDFGSRLDQMVNIRCHHGEIDPRTGLCICEYGWKSEPFNPELLTSPNSIYSMCTIQCEQGDLYKNLPYLLGILIALWLICMVCLCERYNIFVMVLCPRSSSSEKFYFTFNDSEGISCENLGGGQGSRGTKYVTQLCIPETLLTKKVSVNK